MILKVLFLRFIYFLVILCIYSLHFSVSVLFTMTSFSQSAADWSFRCYHPLNPCPDCLSPKAWPGVHLLLCLIQVWWLSAPPFLQKLPSHTGTLTKTLKHSSFSSSDKCSFCFQIPLLKLCWLPVLSSSVVPTLSIVGVWYYEISGTAVLFICAIYNLHVNLYCRTNKIKWKH